jgi:hypothetical protein
MTHEQKHLASCEGLGCITRCNCGTYHVHLTGISIHLDEKAFDRLILMIMEAKKQDLYRLNKVDFKNSLMKMVKN